MYKIVRMRFHGRNTTIKTGLTLEQAQAHCRDPLTHGLSNPHRPGKGKCDEHGIQKGAGYEESNCPICDRFLTHDWFDGYEET